MFVFKICNRKSEQLLVYSSLSNSQIKLINTKKELTFLNICLKVEYFSAGICKRVNRVLFCSGAGVRSQSIGVQASLKSCTYLSTAIEKMALFLLLFWVD